MEQPGFVRGLGRGQKPERSSWVHDAEYWWRKLREELGDAGHPVKQAPSIRPEAALEALSRVVEAKQSGETIRRAAIYAVETGVASDNPRLLKLLAPHLVELEGDSRLKNVRRARRPPPPPPPPAAVSTEPAAEAVVPADWPYLRLTKGRVAVMVGGDLREQTRRNVQRALGFKELTWESGYDVRATQSLASRISRGRVEFVIFLRRFISHKITELLVPACRNADIPWVMVEQGYGLTRICLSIERYLEKRLDAPQRP